jgi:ubiquinone/menaquinone biosynthesis C-methylase UbiE
MDSRTIRNIIASYQTDGGFIVHDRAMLEKIYTVLGIDPKASLDWRIYDLEGITHFFQQGVVALFKKLSIAKEDHLLSLGEGSGAPSRLLVKMSGCRITGVDINPDQIAKANVLAQLHGVEGNVEYHKQNVQELSLRKRDFSKAYCNETCVHWSDKPKAFSRIYEHLKAGALIGFNAWLKGDLGTLGDAYQAIPEFRPLYKQGIWFQEGLGSYSQLLEQAGFRVIEAYDCTDMIDIRMRARVKASEHWKRYEAVMGTGARESALRYYRAMLMTHYGFLRYGVILAVRKH